MLDGFFDELIARVEKESKKEDMLCECGECKNYDKTNHACKRFGINMNANDFCSYFEKKEKVTKLPEEEVAFLKAAMGLGYELCCVISIPDYKIYFCKPGHIGVNGISVTKSSMPYLYEAIQNSKDKALYIKDLVNENVR